MVNSDRIRGMIMRDNRSRLASITIPAKRLARQAFLAAFASGLLVGAPVMAQDASDPDTELEIAPPAPAELPAGAVGGMGDINLYPKRVVIDGRTRIVSVGLYNKSLATGDYEIAVTDMVMMPDGRLLNMDKVTDTEQKSKVKTASQMLRWSPRRVALQANEAQTVRIMARRPADLPDGEYRSHFVVISVPSEGEAGLSIEQAVDDQPNDGIGVRIVPRFGLSIPVIVRVGETTLTTGVRDIELVTLRDGSRGLKMVITRDGTRSSFGNVLVTAPGQNEPVALAQGVGVYPEVDSREIVLPIDPEIDVRALTSGMVWTITYTDDDFEPGAILFRQNFTVP